MELENLFRNDVTKAAVRPVDVAVKQSYKLMFEPKYVDIVIVHDDVKIKRVISSGEQMSVLRKEPKPREYLVSEVGRVLF